MMTHATTSARGTRDLAQRRTLDSRRLAGAAFLLVGTAFLFVTMLAASIAPGYDFHAAAISDLGVIDETALLFGAMLVGIGALDLVGGLLLDLGPRRPLLLAPFVLGGVGAIGAGLVPLDRGTAHSLFALAAFVGFNLQALALATRLHGPLRWVSLPAGIVGLVYVGLMVVGDGGNPAAFGAIGHGGTERMIAYPVMAWLIALGGALLGDADVLGRPARATP